MAILEKIFGWVDEKDFDYEHEYEANRNLVQRAVQDFVPIAIDITGEIYSSIRNKLLGSIKDLRMY